MRNVWNSAKNNKLLVIAAIIIVILAYNAVAGVLSAPVAEITK
tara:strand:- start:715 stop:843 length:129 start_codon:yes stop_codon:yes gene_type:complete